MNEIYRHKETAELLTWSELLDYSKKNNGPNYDFLTPEILQLLNFDAVGYNHEVVLTSRYQYFNGHELYQEADGRWMRQSTVSEHTDQAAKDQCDKEFIEAIKQERNRRLSETDWSQCADTPESIKAKYATYRQKLRDITSVEGFPDNFEWPTIL